jgi:general L-amino acid transport system permease protein
LLHGLPPAQHALTPFPGVFLSDRGLVLPGLTLRGLDLPRHTRFDFVGGITLSPELAALLFALVLHQSAHIAEVVRGAILAVPRGQIEAAHALGLSRWQTLRLVTIPQALRAMVPLLAANCVSLIKNSSLAVAIGFPDVVSVLNTVGNQTGHSVETMVIMIAAYLGASLTVAYALGRYNARITA